MNAFRLPPRFHPAHSLLGGGIRRFVRDPRQAEALFLLSLNVAALALILTNFFAWTWLRPSVLGDPQGSVALVFWTGQVSGVLFFVLTCVVGFAPAAVITPGDAHLFLRQGQRKAVLPYASITQVESVSALCYYRQYRPYAATQSFLNRVTRDVLVVWADGAPYAIGLPPKHHPVLLEFLRERIGKEET